MAMQKGYEETPDNRLTQARMPPPNPVQADIYDIHRQAVADWHTACQAYETAKVRRDQLKAELDKISHEFGDYLTAQMQDPTVPETLPGGSMNGQAKQQKEAQGRTASWTPR